MAFWSFSPLELRRNLGSGRSALFPCSGEGSGDFFTGRDKIEIQLFLGEKGAVQVSSQCSGWSQGSRQHHGTTRPGAIRNSNTQSATLLNTNLTHSQHNLHISLCYAAYTASFSHLLLLHPPCNAPRRWFPSCTSAWKLTTTRGSSGSRPSQPRFLEAKDSQGNFPEACSVFCKIKELVWRHFDA